MNDIIETKTIEEEIFRNSTIEQPEKLTDISRYLTLFTDSDSIRLKYSLRATGLVRLMLELVRQPNKLSVSTFNKHQCLYKELSSLIDKMMSNILSPIEKDIVQRYYGLDITKPIRRTMSEIGAELGFASAEISKIFEGAIRKLRSPYFMEKLKNLLHI